MCVGTLWESGGISKLMNKIEKVRNGFRRANTRASVWEVRWFDPNSSSGDFLCKFIYLFEILGLHCCGLSLVRPVSRGYSSLWCM